MKFYITLFLTLFLLEDALSQNPHDTLYSPDIKRITNYGNGCRRLELTDYSRQYIIDNYHMPQPIYKGKNAHIQVSVYDWSAIDPGDYRLDYDSVSYITTWKLYKIGGPDTVYSDVNISILNHQYIPQWGLVVTVLEDTVYTINGTYINNYPDTSFIEYNGSGCEWISGMEDIDNDPIQNWILSGTDIDDFITLDDNEYLENVLNGRFSAAKTANRSLLETAPWDTVYSNTQAMMQLRDFNSVDIVMTSDTSKWTRCPVLNMDLSIDRRQEILNFPSLDKNGTPDNSGTFGMSWFPGYAIDLETGDRLNMAFSEHQGLTTHNGNDGKFNPDSVRFDAGFPVFGGQHWVYIFGNQDRYFPGQNRMSYYDGGNYMNTMLHGTTSDKIKVWRSCWWMGSVLPEVGHDFLDCDATLKIRMLHANTRGGITNNDSIAKFQFTIPTSQPTSVTEKQIELSQIFPNPSSTGIFHVIIDAPEVNTEISVLDLSGKLVHRSFIYGTEKILDLSSLVNGIYFLQLKNGSNAVSTQKIVINR